MININDESLKDKKVECNECKGVFKFADIIPQEVKVDEANVRYYKCPLCGYVYIIGVDNSDTRTLQKVIKRTNDKISKFTSNGKTPPVSLFVSLRMTRDKMVNLQNKLKFKYQDKLPANL